MGVFRLVASLLWAMLVPKAHLAMENLAFRQQLAVLKGSVKRPKLRTCLLTNERRSGETLRVSSPNPPGR